MKLHNIKPASGGGVQKRKRVGRGHGSGWGTQAGRGHKGQNSRSGKGTRPGFEGGQIELFRRLPKFGFRNPNAKQYEQVNVSDLNIFEEGTEVTPELLIERGLINKNKMKHGLKVLGDGELEVSLTVKAHKFTKSAAEKINSQGGKAEVI